MKVILIKISQPAESKQKSSFQRPKPKGKEKKKEEEGKLGGIYTCLVPRETIAPRGFSLLRIRYLTTTCVLLASSDGRKSRPK